MATFISHVCIIVVHPDVKWVPGIWTRMVVQLFTNNDSRDVMLPVSEDGVGMYGESRVTLQ